MQRCSERGMQEGRGSRRGHKPTAGNVEDNDVWGNSGKIPRAEDSRRRRFVWELWEEWSNWAGRGLGG